MISRASPVGHCPSSSRLPTTIDDPRTGRPGVVVTAIFGDGCRARRPRDMLDSNRLQVVGRRPGVGLYSSGVAIRSRLDPRLEAAVQRAREHAAQAGELTPRGGGIEPAVPADIGAVILELLRDGTYGAALARVTAGDPDISDA